MQSELPFRRAVEQAPRVVVGACSHCLGDLGISSIGGRRMLVCLHCGRIAGQRSTALVSRAGVHRR